MDGDWEHVDHDFFSYEMDSSESESDEESDVYANNIIERCDCIEDDTYIVKEVVDDMINNIVEAKEDILSITPCSKGYTYTYTYRYIVVASIALSIGICILVRYVSGSGKINKN